MKFYMANTKHQQAFTRICLNVILGKKPEIQGLNPYELKLEEKGKKRYLITAGPMIIGTLDQTKKETTWHWNPDSEEQINKAIEEIPGLGTLWEQEVSQTGSFDGTKASDKAVLATLFSLFDRIVSYPIPKVTVKHPTPGSNSFSIWIDDIEIYHYLEDNMASTKSWKINDTKLTELVEGIPELLQMIQTIKTANLLFLEEESFDGAKEVHRKVLAKLLQWMVKDRIPSPEGVYVKDVTFDRKSEYLVFVSGYPVYTYMEQEEGYQESWETDFSTLTEVVNQCPKLAEEVMAYVRKETNPLTPYFDGAKETHRKRLAIALQQMIASHKPKISGVEIQKKKHHTKVFIDGVDAYHYYDVVGDTFTDTFPVSSMVLTKVINRNPMLVEYIFSSCHHINSSCEEAPFDGKKELHREALANVFHSLIDERISPIKDMGIVVSKGNDLTCYRVWIKGIFVYEYKEQKDFFTEHWTVAYSRLTELVLGAPELAAHVAKAIQAEEAVS